MAKVPLEKTVNKRLKNVDKKLKTSFVLIRQDVDEIQETVDAMTKYLKKKDKEFIEQKEEDEKTQEEFRGDVDDFTQKIKQLKLALEAVRDIKKEVVLKKDLAQIEDRIKTSFKNDIENYKDQIKKLRLYLKEAEKRIAALESGKVFEKRQGWFFKKKEEQS